MIGWKTAMLNIFRIFQGIPLMASRNLFSEIKKCVTFIFLKDQGGKYMPNGTGFFVSVNVERDPKLSVVYLVTAKHILQDSNGNFFATVYIRLNKHGGTSQYIDIPLEAVYTHDEPEVDLAIYPLLLDPNEYDYISVASDLISTKKVVAEHNIIEGDEVFFAGLFESHYGQRKNQPILRFGKIALMSDEKIEWKQNNQNASKFLDLYLLECQAYGGNSGSPVFFQLNPFFLPDQLTIEGRPQIYLGGIIMGHFNLDEILHDRLSRQNMGITAVTPADKLYDVLFGKKAIHDRENVPASEHHRKLS